MRLCAKSMGHCGVANNRMADIGMTHNRMTHDGMRDRGPGSRGMD